ncbi:MAG: XRE family transcriptional regulator, partial [Sphingobacteriaceae bacterium]
MNINDKIKQILIDRNFSPSYFADEIGVQRSSISHILS